MEFKMNVAVAVATLATVCGVAAEHGHKHEHGTSCNHGHSHAETKAERPGPFLANVQTADAADSGDGHGHKHEHGGGCGEQKGCSQGAKTVSVPKSVQDVMGLKTVRAEFRRVASTVSFAGRYELNPDARKVVATPVSGRLALLVKSLSDVKKGDALFKVSSPDLVARSHEIEALEKRVNVYRGINTPNAALENELAVKRAERAAMLAGAEEIDGVVTVRAASDGMVESLSAQDGAWLETGAAALQTVRTRDLRFKALVASSDALRLRNGMSAKVDGNHGQIRIGVGDDTGLVPVYVLFGEDVDALAGARSSAECVTDETENAKVAVPSQCIVSIGLQPTVFIRDEHDANRFIAVPVTPGLSGGGWTAVEGVPEPHCEIVSDGVYELKLSLPAEGGKKTSGHFHADGVFHEGEH